jgi:multiple sugar transport system ATP-binding protein
MPEVTLKNLSFSYPSKTEKKSVLTNLSSIFLDGSFNVILGASGSGKTTLLKCLIGDLQPEGEIYFGNKVVNGLLPKDRNLAFVSQQYNLYPHFNVFDNIAFPLKVMNISRKEIEERVNDIANQLRLTFLLSRKPKDLSGGQQQLVAIGRALVKRPSLFLLDEPFSNIDLQKRLALRQSLKKIQMAEKATTVYVTHDFGEAIFLADRIFVLANGSFAFVGTPKQAIDSYTPVINELKEGWMP